MPRTWIGEGVETYRMHKHSQALVKASALQYYSSSNVRHEGSLEGFKAGWGLEAVLETFCIVLFSSSLVCLDCVASVIFELTVSDWIVNSLTCKFNFHLKIIPVLYEVEFSDVY